MPKFYLTNLKTKDDLKQIVIERWNYTPCPLLPLPIELGELHNKVIDNEIIAEHQGFKIVFFQLDEDQKSQTQNIDQFLRSNEREIINKILRSQREANLFVFSSKTGNFWHFINVDQVGNKLKLRRFVIDPENRDRLRTASEQLDKIKIDYKQDNSLQKIKSKHEQAFSVEVLTKKFYDGYAKIFDRIKKDLFYQKRKINNSLAFAHHYTHQLLNRIMFLYFVQKKGCFGGDKEFMRTFWNAYRDNFEGKDKFHKHWLDVLFFEALNKKFTPRNYLKTDVCNFNSVLLQAPYLNGGLFRQNDFDSLDYQITDGYFVEIFDFLEAYNFTIQESTPLDQDLAIDPEMLGNIYEMLVNVSQVSDERHQSGIFYTPKIEIDFMVRRSLVEFLNNKISIDKNTLYQFVFKDADQQTLPRFSQKDKDSILQELDEIKIVDPACGSGHYLVVATQILYELKAQLYDQGEIIPNKFLEKKKIIENSIFGVDVKEWAVDAAKLRLWLDLFVDADKKELKSFKPLLPSLAFKIRVGDSLVQEIAGTYFSPLMVHGLPMSLRRLLSQVKELKKKFYNNYSSVSESQVRGYELRLYNTIIDKKINDNKVEICGLQRDWDKKDGQRALFKFKDDKPKQRTLFELHKKSNQKRIKKLKQANQFLQKQKNALQSKRKIAFWPIEFAEVFAEKRGFDIVIANPPYVRQEIIANPISQSLNLADKRKYKDKLLTQIQADWADSSIRIQKKADLYVYFYLKGLKLLNPDGIFCYISSNSWLDVGYGRELQEILLKRVPMVAIYDNQAKRSFKHADVNTIIALFKAPKSRRRKKQVLDNIVRFVMFKKPLEEIVCSDLFIKIDKIQKRVSTDGFQIHPISQKELLEQGSRYVSSEERQLYGGVYVGDKWGGKYLRAPDIYFKILEKAGSKLVRLGDIADVRFGIKTGANEFFYVEDVTERLLE